jgi:hypothetical protein
LVAETTAQAALRPYESETIARFEFSTGERLG